MLALGIFSASAQAADNACGTVFGVFFGDLPSGGFVAIDGRRFQVGGVGPRNVVLPPATQLRVGVRACTVGEFRALADGAVDLCNGEVFIESRAGTSPSPARPPSAWAED